MNSTHVYINKLFQSINNDPNQILKKALEFYDANFDILNKEYKSEILYIISYTSWAIGDYRKAILFSQYNIENKYTQHGVIYSYKILGNIAVDSEKYSDGLDYYNQGLNLAISSNLEEDYSDFYNNIGSIYSDIHDYDQSIDYFNRALKYVKGDSPKDSIMMINLGEAYIHKKDYQLALEYLENAKKILKNHKAGFLSAYLNSAFGKYYKAIENYGKAIQSILKSNEIYRITNTEYRSISDYILLSDIYGAIGSNEKEIDFLLKAFDLSKAYDDFSNAAKVASLLAEKFTLKGNTNKASFYYKVYHDYTKKREKVMQKQKLNLVRTKEKIKTVEKERNIVTQKNEELTELNEKFELINKIGKEITSDLDFRNVSYKVNSLLLDLVPIDFLIISSLNDERTTLKYLEIDNTNPNEAEIIDEEALLKDTLAEWILENDDIIFSLNYRKEYKKYKKILSGNFESTPNSVIFLPLTLKDKIIGFFSVQSKKKHAYTEKDLDFLKTLTPFISIALENSITSAELKSEVEHSRRIKKRLEQANDKLRILSNYDDLTNLPNRRYLFKYLEKEINLSFRQKKPLTLIIIDIDYFKEYNDNYGHIKGDHCLKIVAQLLNSSLKRKSDFVARYGGDEFIIILPNTEKQGAINIINDIKQAMNFESIEHNYSQTVPRVTLSIGGHTTFGYKKYKPEILIKEADDSLYWIKNQGRNDFLVTEDEKPNA
jgi:diguanylate cyclase (GGDEF)-like protein